ncbi:MAG: hypothetical protein Q7S42_05835 [Candidatus Omnitrophota bacterium]|nr:hypothetical protein [Candidatus Omnitrophota bacterium]
MATKEQVRPTYGELMGYLSQIPTREKSELLYDADVKIVEQIEQSIDELNEITGQNFNKFKVGVQYYDNGKMASVVEIRTNLNGLIMRLHAMYFSDENAPFGGGPSMVVNQNQHQSQSQVTMLLEFQSLIDKKLNDPDVKPEEKGFLEKLKVSLPSIKSATELLSTAISIAKDCGLSIDTVHHLLK